MKAVTPLCFLLRSTEAKTRKWSAMSAREIQIFWPLSRYASPSRRAVVWRFPASVPTPGLGQPERRQLLAACLRDEPAPALLLGPPLEERQRVEPDVDALDDTERGVGTFQLLAQDREADVVHPGAAVRLRDRRAEEPELAHLGEDLAVDLALLVPLADVRQDLGLGEGAHALLHEAVLVGQGEVDHGPDRSRGPHDGRRAPGQRRPGATLYSRADGDRPEPDARPRPLFRAVVEPRRGSPAVRHRRSRLPRFRERHRGHRARPPHIRG